VTVVRTKHVVDIKLESQAVLHETFVYRQVGVEHRLVYVMLLTGKTFNFVAIVGTLGLIGMIIKNGIVLMDEITLQINQGVEPVTALIDSSQSRLRPVMMASLTTILGMIPLLPDAMFGSLAASIMGGLLFGTLITLLFIPILYALFFHIKKTDK
jgi:multidrug efflux pump subunit AcrB